MLPLLGVLCPSLERLVESYISYLHGRFFAPVHSVGEPVVFFFFFSSRRRHTRCLSDWSSDVCSSDLCERARPSPFCHLEIEQHLVKSAHSTESFELENAQSDSDLFPRNLPKSRCQRKTSP